MSEEHEESSGMAAIADAVTALNVEAKRLYDAGKYEQAMQTALAARSRAEALGPHPATAGALYNLAAAYQKLARFGEADQCYDQLLALLQDAGVDDPGMTAMILHGRGLLYSSQGRLADARRNLQEAVTLLDSVGEAAAESLSAALNVLGDTLRRLALFREANGALERSRELRTTAESSRDPAYARTLWNLAVLRKDEGRFTEADQLYGEALAILTRAFPEGHPDIGGTRAALATLRLAEGRHAEALQEAERALDLLKPLLPATQARVADVLNTMAGAQEALGRLTLAEPLYQEALARWQEAFGGSSSRAASALVNLAHLRHETGDYETARKQLGQACDMFVAANLTSHPDYAGALSGLVATDYAVGDLESARTRARQVLRILEAALGERHTDVIVACASAAALELECGDVGQAQRLLDLATARMSGANEASPVRALVSDNLGMAAMARGDLAEAETQLRDALRIREQLAGASHPALAVPLDNLALCHAVTGRWDDAIAFKARAFAIRSRAIGEVFAIGSERQRLAHVHQLQDDLHGLVALVMQSPSRSSDAIRICADAVLERKAIVVEALAAERDAILGQRHPELAPTFAELQDVRRQLAAHMRQGPGFGTGAVYQAGLTALLEQCESLERTLVKQLPEAALDKRMREVSCASVAEALPAGSVLLELLVYRGLELQLPLPPRAPWGVPRYLAVVIPSARDGGDVELFDVGDADTVNRLVETVCTPERMSRVRDLLPPGASAPRSAEPGAWDKAADKLRELIFAPLARKLEGCSRIFVSPDGALVRVPLATLPDGQATDMIDRYEFVSLGAGRDVLRFAAPRSTAATSALVIGDPDFDAWKPPYAGGVSGQRFERLPCAMDEAVWVARSLAVAPLTGRNATEGAIREHPAPRVLHLATHGFFMPPTAASTIPDGTPGSPAPDSRSRCRQLVRGDVENPLLRSGVALAGANTWLAGGELPLEAEDGLLYAEDVTRLDLSGALVVLSACNTGLGEVDVGEGVFGLQRAFAVAGARTMIMSLWSVPDRETKDLMIAFYDGLVKGLGCADALRRAQRELREHHKEVSCWGAFVCQGDPGTIDLAR